MRTIKNNNLIPTVNRIDTYQTYLKETNRKVVRQGEFLWWAFHEAEGENYENNKNSK